MQKKSFSFSNMENIPKIPLSLSVHNGEGNASLSLIEELWKGINFHVSQKLMNESSLCSFDIASERKQPKEFLSRLPLPFLVLSLSLLSNKFAISTYFCDILIFMILIFSALLLLGIECMCVCVCVLKNKRESKPNCRVERRTMDEIALRHSSGMKTILPTDNFKENEREI